MFHLYNKLDLQSDLSSDKHANASFRITRRISLYVIFRHSCTLFSDASRPVGGSLIVGLGLRNDASFAFVAFRGVTLNPAIDADDASGNIQLLTGPPTAFNALALTMRAFKFSGISKFLRALFMAFLASLSMEPGFATRINDVFP